MSVSVVSSYLEFLSEISPELPCGPLCDEVLLVDPVGDDRHIVLLGLLITVREVHIVAF